MKQEKFDKNFKVLRYDSAEYARQPDTWFENAMSLKRASELLLEQQVADEETMEQRRERLIKHVEAGGLRNDFLNTYGRLHPPSLHVPIALLRAMAIEFQLKAILIAVRPMEFVTNNGLDERLTSHNLQELIRLINERQPNTIQVRGKTKLLNRLQLIVKWGKYGFPKNPKEYRKLIDSDSETEGIGEGIGGVGLSNDEIVACDALFENLKDVYSILHPRPL